ncbi:MAG: hypothetical protein ACRDH5_01450 [bacterium]
MDDNLVGLVAVVLLFGGGTLFLLAISPIGKAVAAKLLGRAAPVVDEDEINEEFKSLRREIAELRQAGGSPEGLPQIRQEMAELAERVDFVERLLAKVRDADRLASPR